MSEEMNAQQPSSDQGQPETPAVAQNTDIAQTAIPYDRFKQKVDEANALKARLDEFERKEKERAQAELSEVERLKAQLSELEPFKQQTQSLNQLIEQVLQRELESVPEDKRSLIQGDTPAAKLQDLTRLKALGLFVPQQQPQKADPVKLDSQTGATPSGKGTLPDAQSQLAAIAQQHGYKIDQQQLAERIQNAKRGGTK